MRTKRKRPGRVDGGDVERKFVRKDKKDKEEKER